MAKGQGEYGRWYKCWNCGKEIYIEFPDEWVYKVYQRSYHKVCSWKCMREAQKRVADEKEARKIARRKLREQQIKEESQ